MRRRHAISTFAGALVLAACGGGGPVQRGSGSSLLATADAAGLDRFLRAVEAAGLSETLAGPGPYTVFAPTDGALGASGAGRLDQEALQRVIAYHIVPGRLTSDFMEGVDVNHTTLLGTSLNVDGTGPALRVNGANVVRGDLDASNGVVFVIDRVLTPR